MKKIKKENQILIMLAFFSISVGLWGNFRQLWLQDNKFSVTNISNILSIGTLISVIIIGLIGKYIKLDKIIGEGKESICYDYGDKVVKIFKEKRTSPFKRISDEGLKSYKCFFIIFFKYDRLYRIN